MSFDSFTMFKQNYIRYDPTKIESSQSAGYEG